jgi:signal peptidase I
VLVSLPLRRRSGCSRGVYAGFGALVALLLFPGRLLAGEDAPSLPSRRLLDALPSADLRALPLLLLTAAIAFGALLLIRHFARRGESRRRLVTGAGGLLLLVSLLPVVAISGPGMARTAHAGDTVIVDPLARSLDLLARGDLVVVTPPGEEAEPVVRRLIGLPGDTVELRRKAVFLNGVLLEERYVVRDAEPASVTDRAPLTLGVDEFYVLADDRTSGGDSRSFGPIAGAAISGRAVALLRTDPAAGTQPNDARLLLVGCALLLAVILLFARHRVHLRLRPLLVVATLLLLVGVLRPYHLVGTSMAHEVSDGDTVLAEGISPRIGLLNRGDIVAITSRGREQEGGSDISLVKRIVGLPGETLVFKRGHLRINGVPHDEPYLDPWYLPDCGCFRYEPGTVTLGPDEYFVLGDNRADSYDSRSFGPVPLADIEARVIAILRAGPFE